MTSAVVVPIAARTLYTANQFKQHQLKRQPPKNDQRNGRGSSTPTDWSCSRLSRNPTANSVRSPNPQDRGDAGGLERSFCKAQGAEDRNSRQPTANIPVPQVPYDCFQLKPKAAKLLGASLGKLPRRTKPLTTRRSNQARRPSEHRDECRGQDNLQEFFRQ